MSGEPGLSLLSSSSSLGLLGGRPHEAPCQGRWWQGGRGCREEEGRLVGHLQQALAQQVRQIFPDLHRLWDPQPCHTYQPGEKNPQKFTENLTKLQVLATNTFLGGTFLTYGTDVHSYYQTPPEENKRLGRHNPMCEAFPRVVYQKIILPFFFIFYHQIFLFPGCQLLLLPIRRGRWTGQT